MVATVQRVMGYFPWTSPKIEEAAESPRLKGVVPQPKGRWGAQIYDSHGRVWLGTFPDEDSAARAYHVAADAAEGELAFLLAHSKSEVVDMLRRHAYADELRQGLRRQSARALPTPPWARVPLFEKTLTPSDVRRLVVPKQHAEKHFPLRRVQGKGVLLTLEDGEGKLRWFRYRYWNSSKSYVLTKGWSCFVKEKGLRAGGIIAFYRSARGPNKQLFIECKKTTTMDGNGSGAVMLFGVDIAGGSNRDKSECLTM